MVGRHHSASKPPNAGQQQQPGRLGGPVSGFLCQFTLSECLIFYVLSTTNQRNHVLSCYYF
jgi:hypothetical protein